MTDWPWDTHRYYSPSNQPLSSGRSTTIMVRAKSIWWNDPYLWTTLLEAELALSNHPHTLCSYKWWLTFPSNNADNIQCEIIMSAPWDTGQCVVSDAWVPICPRNKQSGSLCWTTVWLVDILMCLRVSQFVMATRNPQGMALSISAAPSNTSSSPHDRPH